MAKVYITEYARQGKDTHNNAINTGEEPPVAVQVVAIGGASVQSSAFDPKTRFVRIHTDATCSILFGANPTATANSPRFVADSTEYAAVDPMQVASGMKLAVITNT